MENKSIMSFSVKYETEKELYSYVVKLYNLVCNKEMAPREVDFVVFYLKYGYNQKSKSILMAELDVEASHVNVVNFHLRKKGILVQDENNKNKSHLSDEITRLKEFVEDEKNKKIIPIIFNV